jgi:hypothetical protein
MDFIICFLNIVIWPNNHVRNELHQRTLSPPRSSSSAAESSPSSQNAFNTAGAGKSITAASVASSQNHYNTAGSGNIVPGIVIVLV